MSEELPTEIVARLRQLTPEATGKSYVWGKAMKDAADEIERLRIAFRFNMLRYAPPEGVSAEIDRVLNQPTR